MSDEAEEPDRERRRGKPDESSEAPGDPAQEKRLGLLAVIGSTLAAAFGVQSRKARERDFTRGNVVTFLIAGVVFTVLFVVAVSTVVQLVIGAAGD